jgi:hypothetical protein
MKTEAIEDNSSLNKKRTIEITDIKTVDKGLYGKNKFYNLKLEAVKYTNECQTINLKYINPIIEEI